MKRFLLSAVLVILGTSSLGHAQVAPEEPPASWVPNGSLSLGLQQEYIPPRLAKLSYDGPVSVIDLNLKLPYGFYTRVWDFEEIGPSPMHLKNHPGDQLFLFLGWEGKVADLDVRTYVNFVNLAPVDHFAESDVMVESLSVSKTFSLGEHIIRPEFRGEWLSRLSDLSRGSVILMPNLTHTWKHPFGLDRVSINDQWTIQWMSSFEKLFSGDGIFLEANVYIGIEIAPRLELDIGYFELLPLHRPSDGRGEAGFAYGSLKWSF